MTGEVWLDVLCPLGVGTPRRCADFAAKDFGLGEQPTLEIQQGAWRLFARELIRPSRDLQLERKQGIALTGRTSFQNTRSIGMRRDHG